MASSHVNENTLLNMIPVINIKKENKLKKKNSHTPQLDIFLFLYLTLLSLVGRRHCLQGGLNSPGRQNTGS